MATTYLVTGANRGIGLEFVRQLTARGERVIATTRRESPELAGTGARVERLDVTDAGGIGALAAALDGERIDVLINNAGVGSNAKSVDQLTFEELDRVFRVNAFAPMMVCRAVLPMLEKSDRKLIVNISTQLASIATNTGGSSYAYRASKTALNQLTVCLSNELRGKGFTCVAMHPGWVKTDMGGSAAPLTPQNSVSAMLGVIDRLGVGDTGRYLNYDGGPLAW